MSPKIAEGQEVLVSSLPFLFFEPKIGDIVAFKKFNKVFIKRVKKINSDKYYLIGDNKEDSLDSKNFGWVSKKLVIGKALIY